MSKAPKSSEIAIPAGKHVKLTKEEKLSFIGTPLALSGTIMAIIAGTGFTANVPAGLILNVVSILACTTLPLSGLVSTAALSTIKKGKTAKVLYGEATANNEYQTTAKMKESKKGRTFVNSFFIRETGEIDVNSWQEYDRSVTVDQSTHTVNQYMVKDKSGYRVEQEAIPNDETVWDISADALVEVYKVKESQTKYTFQPKHLTS